MQRILGTLIYLGAAACFLGLVAFGALLVGTGTAPVAGYLLVMPNVLALCELGVWKPCKTSEI